MMEKTDGWRHDEAEFTFGFIGVLLLNDLSEE